MTERTVTDLSGVDLATLAERDGVVLHGRRDAETWGACPVCGGHDRFHVLPKDSKHDRARFFCRQCHDTPGDAIEFLRWAHGFTFSQAVAELGLRREDGGRTHKPRSVKPATRKTARGLAIPEHLAMPPPGEWQTAARAFALTCAARLWTPEGARALAYLRGRGLSDDTIRAFDLGLYWPKDSTHKRAAGFVVDVGWINRGITIPHYFAGALWGVKVRRSIADIDQDRAQNVIQIDKYKAATGSHFTAIFNGDGLAGERRPHTVLVAEGEFDCLLAGQFAPPGMAVVTRGSAQSAPTWEADYLTRGKKVLVALDADPAGNRAAAKWAAFGDRVRVPVGKDITEYWQQAGDVGAWLRSMLAPPLNPWLADIASLPDERARLEAWGEAKGLEVTYLSEAGDRLRMARTTAS